MNPRTPGRPLDVEALFPEVAPYRRRTVRLHPRAGSPRRRDSSVGGPLLWPAEEPWPTCPDHPGSPMVAVLQLRLIDLPEEVVPFPDGCDLLQVLWCPRDHDGCWVEPLVVWRRAPAKGARVRPAPPPPAGAVRQYLPRPCTVHPEAVTEYPSWDLPQELWDALEERFDRLEEERGWAYQYHLSTAPGIKLGGYPGWSQEPDVPRCPVCRQPMEHLLTVESTEGDALSSTAWTPADEGPRAEGPGLTLGDLGGVYLFECRRCPGRPFAQRFDCA
ncbi:DUF1963 domain-containing protein [Kitasatospora sp. NPDC051853]|uniref:DUF1963 domain-containing protein n=1 Tax=Kitasatospora sp. NPDC051853 TaxID=3364058 RepID=UPI0037B97D7D